MKFRFLTNLHLIRSMSSSVKREITFSSEKPGPIENSIASKLIEKFNPSFLKIDNDSAKHAHHSGIRGASNVTESHFRLIIISELFKGQNMPSRHRAVYQALEDELKNKGVHALQMKTKTPEEVNDKT